MTNEQKSKKLKIFSWKNNSLNTTEHFAYTVSV